MIKKANFPNIEQENDDSGELKCEETPMFERIKQSYEENSMLGRFIKFLRKKSKKTELKGGKNNGKNKNAST